MIYLIFNIEILIKTIKFISFYYKPVITSYMLIFSISSKEISMDIYKSTLDGLISQWLHRAENEEKNEELLFLDKMESNVDEIKKKLNNLFRHSYQILDVDSYIYDKKWMRGAKNIILYSTSRYTNKFPIKYIEERILFVGEEYDFLKKIEKYSMQNNETNISNRYLYYVENLEPLNIIYNVNLKSFIDKRIKYIQSIYFNKNHSILFNGIDYVENNNTKIIEEDIIFFDMGILKSRLAVLIYRISTLNLNASITEAGRYYSRELGIKSKTYNIELLKKLKNIQTLPFYTADSILNLKKNFKAYDLNSKESEDKIRKEITKRLVDFMEKDDVLNIENISKITKLSRDEIRKLTLKGI